MSDHKHGRAKMVARYLGLVSDEPRPKAGSRAWWVSIAVSGACGAAAVLLLGWLDWF